jgi:hypothetical protein
MESCRHLTARRSAERIVVGIDDALSLLAQVIPDKQFCKLQKGAEHGHLV